ncbi:MAG: indolepyruvate oxidoreductase subunit beta [Sedimentisphaerales bacterium]|nr:indolepyruvate oxidoreductase subunit beta [Sedimentisphaerales bacterium]
MDKKVCNIVFGGIGGQGILKASEICGWAALYDGRHVRKSEVHGMAQRGGSVESHLRFGKEVYSPLVEVGKADYLLCFHEEEHPRLKPFLKEGGVDLIGYLSRVREMIENPKAINTAMVGVLASYLSIGQAAWMKALETVFPAKILELNKTIFLQARALRDAV